MADQHIGYPGSVNSSQLATWIPNVGTAQYSVENVEDGRVITNGIGDRGVTVKRGTIIGDGILDVFETDVNLNFSSVSPGSPDRWDMVVLRRTWNATPGASTSVYTIIQGGPNRTLPARQNNKGVISDQPMALCRIRAGQNNVQEVVDLRVWAHNTGLTALDELVMLYLDQPGTKLDVNGKLWAYNIVKTNNNLAAQWTLVSMLDHIQIGPIGSPVFGGLPPDNSPFMIQAGCALVGMDGSSYGRITWPMKFPNGVLMIQLTNGDSFASGGAVFNIEGNAPHWGSSGTGNTVDVVFNGYDKNGNGIPGRLVRVHFLVIGW